MSYWSSVATLIDLGKGAPLVLVPGIQGRWEWMRPAAEALAKRTRVLTFSLCGDPGSGCGIDPALGFDSFVAQVDAVLERAGVPAAGICGVSYGGFIAVRYAAIRPQRVTCLILTSSPGPTWRPDTRAQRYVRTPWLHVPAFVLGSGRGLWPEISAAFPPLTQRLQFGVSHLGRVLAWPASPARMSQRVTLLKGVDFVADAARVTAPTLVITGEPHLDRVVPVESTRDYLRYIAGARAVTLEHTGHIGLLTRADRYADVVSGFVAAPAGARGAER
jgi:pimeloyl-ACP methyl ester carboxylesterase